MTLDPPSSTQDYRPIRSFDEDYLILSTIHSAKGLVGFGVRDSRGGRQHSVGHGDGLAGGDRRRASTVLRCDDTSEESFERRPSRALLLPQPPQKRPAFAQQDHSLPPAAYSNSL